MNEIRIVPVLSQGSSHIFTSAAILDPWLDPATKTLTSAIQPGIRFDMIGACTTQEMYDNGTADCTDVLSVFNARIDNLFYQTPNGKVHKLFVGKRNSFLFRASEANPSRLLLDTKVMLDHYGVPTTWFGKALRKLRNFVGHRRMVTMHVMGYVEVEMGAVEVQVVEPSNSDIKVVGYTLDMARTNFNRRPRQVEHV